MREFGRGVSMLVGGFAWWRRAPGTMSAGLIPAAIVGALLGAGIIALAAFLPTIVSWATPFAENWPAFWAIATRIVVGAATLVGALIIAALSFTALTLMVGEPFYDRIWRTVESAYPDGVPEASYGFLRALGDAASLILRGILVAILAGAIGLVPLVGGVLAAVLGAAMTGWLLADELSSRALTARGIPRAERRALLRAHRARALGFGVATQACFLVPLGAVVAMPAAVVGATLLARSALESSVPTPAEPA